MESLDGRESWRWTLPHSGGFVDGMNDDTDYDDIIRRLFALITANAEDLATLAVDGQAADLGSERRAELVNQIGLVTDLCRSAISLCHLGLERERADAAQI